MTTRPQKDAHRFFNAMVLMGGSLALGCGGATADGEGTDGSGSQGSGAGGSGSRGSGAGGTGGASQRKSRSGEFTDLGDTGGAPSMGSGGIPSSGTGGVATGGAPMVATGGAAGSPVDQPTFDLTACQPSQWVCPAPECSYIREGVIVPAGCRCDPNLPVDVVCGPSEILACLHGTRDANGSPIEVDFSCRCVPAATACDACPRIFGGPSRLSCDESRFETGQIICGCAVVYLR